MLEGNVRSGALVAVVAANPADDSADGPARTDAVERGFIDSVAAHHGDALPSRHGRLLACFSSVHDALTCAADVRDRLASDATAAAPVGIAVHAGETVEEGGQPVGEAVITASALAEVVPAGQIWCTDSVRSLRGSRPGFAFRRRVPDDPPAFAAPDEVFSVSVDPAVRASVKLAGRDVEVDQTECHLRRALSGRGGLLLVTGEAGVGKTRLAREIMTNAAAHGALALAGRCEAAAGVPYRPFVDLLDGFVAAASSPTRALAVMGEDAPELAKLMPRLRMLHPAIPPPLHVAPAQERRLLADSLHGFLTRVAQQRPVVLLVEDVHWTDENSVFLLANLAERIEQLPALFVLTARADELDPSSPAGGLADELLRRRLATRISLSPLARTAVSQLIAELAGQPPSGELVDTIWSVTEGNPFFVEETYRHLREEGRLFDDSGRLHALDRAALDVPPTVRLTLRRRLGRLGDAAGQALSAAAVIGRHFSVQLLAELCEISSAELNDILERAEQADLIVAAGTSGFAFTHELVRQTLLAGLPTLRRQRLHAQVADAIERAVGSAPEHAADIAYHFAEAGDVAEPARSLRFFALAGKQALEAAAFGDAVRYYEQALRASSTEPRESARLLLGRGAARHGTGDWQGAVADWHAALDLFEQLGDAEAAAEAALRIIRRMSAAGQLPDAVAVSVRALDALGPNNASASRARVLALRARILGITGQRADADRTLTLAMDDARSIDDGRVQGELLAQKGLLHWTHMEAAECAETTARALDLLGTDGDPWPVSEALWEHTVSLLVAGRIDDVRQSLPGLFEVAERTGNAIARYAAMIARCGLAMCAGDLDELAATAREVIAFCGRAGISWSSIAHGYLGLTESWRGRRDNAGRHFADALRLETASFYRGADRAALAAFTAIDDHEQAFALIATLEEQDRLPTAGIPSPLGTWSALLSTVEALTLLGERERAGQLYPLVREAIGTGTVVDLWGMRLIERTAGIAAAAAGRWVEADEHFRTALDQADRLPHRLEQPEVRRCYAQFLVARGEPDDLQLARVLLDEAVAQYLELGLAHRAASLHELAFSPRPSPVAAGPPVAGRPTAGFRREGDVWALDYAGRTVRVRHSLGMQYLATLLRAPGRELHALDLATEPDARPGSVGRDPAGDGAHVGLGDAGAMLDPTAKAAYRARLDDLALDLAEAQEFNDLERAARIDEEIETLVNELSRAVGLGGRDRRAASAAERARLNVTRALRSAIDRIAAAHSELGQHLRATVRTGTYCLYQPDPAAIPPWEL